MATRRVAIVCSGIGHIRRGYETGSLALFERIYGTGRFDMMLLGGGQFHHEGYRRVWCLPRHGWAARLLQDPERAQDLESRSFALAAYPIVRKMDIVHVSQILACTTLFRLRQWFGGRYRLLFWNAADTPPCWYAGKCDFVQHLAVTNLDRAVRESPQFEQSRHCVLPYAVDTMRFAPTTRAEKTRVRRNFNVPDDMTVILSVGQLDKRTKRMDYVIREVARLGPRHFLFLVGQEDIETKELRNLAEELLPGRHRFATAPRSQMAEVYATGDVFVLASLREGLGLVLLEAMSAGLPTIAHDDPLFRWIAGQSNAAACVDMSQEGALSAELQGGIAAYPSNAQRSEVSARFSWEALGEQYVAMYERVASLPSTG